MGSGLGTCVPEVCCAAPDPIAAIGDGISAMVSSCNVCKHIKDPSDMVLSCYC